MNTSGAAAPGVRRSAAPAFLVAAPAAGLLVAAFELLLGPGAPELRALSFSGLIHLAATAAGFAATGALLLLPAFAAFSRLAALAGRATKGALGASGLAGAGVAILLFVSARNLLSGPRARELPLAGAGPFIAAALGFVGPRAAAPLLRRLAASPRAGAALLAASALPMFLADAWILPRLYPAFHGLLALATTSCLAGAAGLLAVGRRRPATRLHVLLALGVLPLGLAATAGVARDPAWRFLVSERAVLLSRPLRLLLPLLPASMAMPAAPADPAGAEADLRRDAEADARGRALLAPARSTLAKPLTIALVGIDALRPDHVSCFGYRRPTTPNLDALASRGVRFTRMHTQVPDTFGSAVTLVTGWYPDRFLLGDAAGPPELLPAALRRHGLRTATIFGHHVIYGAGERGGLADFEAAHDLCVQSHLSGAEIVERALAFRAEHAAEPVFLWLHMMEPHQPYAPDPRFAFGESTIDRYDGEIRAADDALGRLASGLGPEAYILVTSDHGEEFGEHGAHAHGSTTYQGGIHVPLVICGPGIGPGVVEEPVGTVDLWPTVAALAGAPRNDALDGISLVPALFGDIAALAGRGGILVDARLQSRRPWSDPPGALVERRHKVIARRVSGVFELYDLVEDPGERRNLAGEEPGLLREVMGRFAGALARRAERWRLLAERAGGAAPSAALLALSDPRAALGSPDAAVRVAALRQLAATGLRGDPAVLRERFGMGTPDERPWAALALARTLGDGEPWPFEAALAATDPEARHQALDLLYQRPVPAAIGGLLAMVEGGGPPFERARAAAALLRTGWRPAIAIAVGFLGEDIPRDEAMIEILGALAGRREAAVPRHLRDVAPRMLRHALKCQYALRVLETFRTPAAAEAVRILGDAKDSSVRAEAGRVAGVIAEGLRLLPDLLRDAAGSAGEARLTELHDPYFAVAEGRVAGVDFLDPAAPALPPGDWAAPNDYVPFRAPKGATARVHLPPIPGRGATAWLGLRSAGPGTLVVAQDGREVGRFDLRAGPREVVRFRLAPTAGAAAASLRIEIAGADPTLVGFDELGILPDGP